MRCSFTIHAHRCRCVLHRSPTIGCGRESALRNVCANVSGGGICVVSCLRVWTCVRFWILERKGMDGRRRGGTGGGSGSGCRDLVVARAKWGGMVSRGRGRGGEIQEHAYSAAQISDCIPTPLDLEYCTYPVSPLLYASSLLVLAVLQYKIGRRGACTLVHFETNGYWG
jgi:hypothetical protein